MGMTIEQLLAKATRLLKEHGVATARLDAEVILAHLLNCQRIDFIIKPREIIEESIEKQYQQKIKERSQGKPVQYIIGQQEFMGLNFQVTPAVLIPRPDTEILVERAIEEAENMHRPLNIVDIGTGSGAITLSLAHFIQGCHVHSVDISKEASEIAQENARNLCVEEKVTFYIGDIFSPLGPELQKSVDLLISNPPYIPREEINHLQREVRLFEPHLALDGGEDGLDFYRRLIQEGKKFLSSQGKMIFEVGHDQAEDVVQIMKEEDYFKRIEIKKDLAGIKRVVLGEAKHFQP